MELIFPGYVFLKLHGGRPGKLFRASAKLYNLTPTRLDPCFENLYQSGTQPIALGHNSDPAIVYDLCGVESVPYTRSPALGHTRKNSELANAMLLIWTISISSLPEIFPS